MASNIREFNLEIQRAKDSIPGLVEKRQRAAVLQLVSGLVLRSPVDKGRFRMNWQVGTDSPPLGEVPGADPSGALALARAAVAVQNVKPFSLTHIVNNVPYAERLANGWSQQAPAGWVEAAVDEVQTWLNTAP